MRYKKLIENFNFQYIISNKSCILSIVTESLLKLGIIVHDHSNKGSSF